jgi:hypothetical protein
MIKPSKILFLSVLLSACGQGTQTLTIHTPYERLDQKIELTQFFKNTNLQHSFNLPVTQVTPTCKQSQFRVAFIDPNNQANNVVKEVPLITEIETSSTFINPTSGAVGLTDATDWLNNHSAISGPIQLNIPVNVSGFIKFNGAFFEPIAGNTPGTDCSNFDPTSVTSTPVKTYTVYRDQAYTPSQGTSINLSPFVAATEMGSTTYSVPTMDSNGTITNAVGTLAIPALKCSQESDKTTCANRGLLRFFVPSTFNKIKVSYLNTPPNLLSIAEWINFSSSGSQPKLFFIPKNPSYKFEYQDPFASGSPAYTVYLSLIDNQIKYNFDNNQVSQTLLSCNFNGVLMLVGNLPRTTTAPNAATSCTGNNFSIYDLGQKFY